jgi:hypothetical protein
MTSIISSTCFRVYIGFSVKFGCSTDDAIMLNLFHRAIELIRSSGLMYESDGDVYGKEVSLM